MKRLTLLLLLCLFTAPVFAASPSLIQFLAGGIMDSNGSPLTAGTAYFYEAGYANDPAHTKNVWTDFAKTATATYITLGGTGHAPGGATVFGDGLYDIVIKDADGDTLCTLRSVDVFYFNPENLAVSGTFTVTGDIVVSDDLTVGDDAAIGDDLTVGGDAVITSDLTVTGASTNFRNAIKAVDGSGSGIDADLLDAKHATDFVSSSTYSASDVLTKLKTVDGTGSGLDADLLDGKHATDFLASTTTYALDDLTDVSTSGVASGNVLTYNGSSWTPAAPSSAGSLSNTYDLTYVSSGAISSDTSAHVFSVAIPAGEEFIVMSQMSRYATAPATPWTYTFQVGDQEAISFAFFTSQADALNLLNPVYPTVTANGTLSYTSPITHVILFSSNARDYNMIEGSGPTGGLKPIKIVKMD